MRHEVGVPDADAIAKRPHLREIGDFAPHFFNHETCPRVVGREDVLERADVVPLSATPGLGAQVEPVVDTEMHVPQYFLVDSVPQPAGSAATRPSKWRRMSRPSARSGVAVSPSSSTGFMCSRSAS